MLNKLLLPILSFGIKRVSNKDFYSLLRERRNKK